MTGDVDETVQREKQSADERGITQALVRSFAQRKRAPNEHDRAGEEQVEMDAILAVLKGGGDSSGG